MCSVDGLAVGVELQIARPQSCPSVRYAMAMRLEGGGGGGSLGLEGGGSSGLEYV